MVEKAGLPALLFARVHERVEVHRVPGSHHWPVVPAKLGLVTTPVPFWGKAGLPMNYVVNPPSLWETSERYGG